MEKKLVSVIMGSQSDWKTMTYACDVLEEFKIKYEKKLFQLTEHLIAFLNMPKMLIKKI